MCTLVIYPRLVEGGRCPEFRGTPGYIFHWPDSKLLAICVQLSLHPLPEHSSYKPQRPGLHNKSENQLWARQRIASMGQARQPPCSLSALFLFSFNQIVMNPAHFSMPFIVPSHWVNSRKEEKNIKAHKVGAFLRVLHSSLVNESLTTWP